MLTGRRAPLGEPGAAWDEADYRAHHDERAAIAEYDGGRDGVTAERIAFEGCVVEWLNRNPPVQADPHRCMHCSQPGEPGGVLLPVLTGAGGHVWVHDRCYAAWWHCRRAEAVAALGALGLTSSR